MHRFYIPPAAWNPDALALDEGESHHALNVLRLQPGEKVVVFNGQGTEATATVAPDSTKRAVRLTVVHRAKTPPLPCRITLAQAVPKGKNMDLIVQKATELGAARDRSPVVGTHRLQSRGHRERRRQTGQVAGHGHRGCQAVRAKLAAHRRRAANAEGIFRRAPVRNDLMLIASLQHDSRHLRIYLEEHGGRPASALILVGPEGDFTPAEIALAKSAGCRPITLGPIVLRTETAAIYCLSVLSYELQAG